LDSKVVATYKVGSDTYYLIVQSDSDVGGELLVKSSPDGARIVKCDTTVFPLDETQIPASALEALSPLSTEGPPQTEEYAPPTVPPPDLSETQLDGLVYAQAQAADGTLHTNVPGTSGGALACAWAVNEVVRRALGRPIGGGLSTANMYDVLRTKHHFVTEAQSEPGTIIISPTVGNNHGHVGIVSSRGAGASIGSTIIYSNRSSAALFGHAFTIDRWHAYFGAKHLPVLYFQLDPQQFVPAIAAPAVVARWVPPGLNVVGDMYAGDARHPDFAQIRAAGITAFIHKATDPIYSFNADLYNSRKEQALRAGLLWGSYHFGRAGDGTGQANTYLDAINPSDDEFVCLDFEKDRKRPDTVMSLSQAAAFVNRVQQRLGKPPFLYGGAYLRESLDAAASSPLTVCDLWFADYRQRPGPEIPHLWNSWSFWQYAGDIPADQPGSLPTLDNTDRDVFRGTDQELRAAWRCRPAGAA
jgi:GH25 family lysozyme M1 (1,4-beta-N-acetylmuramidase)